MNDLQELLHRRAEDVRVPADLPPATFRRARRRRGWTAAFVGVTTITLVAGTVVALQSTVFSSNRKIGNSPAPTTPGPTEAPSPAPPVVDTDHYVPAVWPEANLEDILAEQAAVDGGTDAWRTDPIATTREFVQRVLRWDGRRLTVTAILDGPLQNRPCTTQCQVLAVPVSPDSHGLFQGVWVALSRLASAGTGGIWSVVDVGPDVGTPTEPARDYGASFFEAGPESDGPTCGFTGDELVRGQPALLCGWVTRVAGTTVSFALLQGDDLDLTATRDAPVRGEIPTDRKGRFAGRMTERVADDTTVLFVEMVDADGQVVTAATSRVRIAPTAVPTPAGTTPSTGGTEIRPDAIDLALWPAASPAALDGLRQQIADGTASYALDPEETAVEFAVQVMGWRRDSVAITTLADAFLVRPADEAIGIWNTELGGPRSSATSVYLVAAPGIDDRPAWLVSYVTSGLFELSCPSVQEPTLDTTRPFEVCGTLMEPGAGRTATATVEYSESQLQPSEAASNLDLRIDGARFGGLLQLIATYPSDVSFAVRLFSSEGTQLGIDARRMIVTRERDPGSTVRLTDQVKDTRSAIMAAADAGSYEGIRRLIGQGFTFSFGDAGGESSTADRAIAFWQRDGVEPLRVMSALLEMPYTTVPTDEGLTYAWPALYDWTPHQLSRIDELAPEWRGALEQIYPDFDRQLQSWIDFGGYLGWRIGIAEDGRWMFFVAGD